MRFDLSSFHIPFLRRAAVLEATRQAGEGSPDRTSPRHFLNRRSKRRRNPHPIDVWQPGGPARNQLNELLFQIFSPVFRRVRGALTSTVAVRVIAGSASRGWIANRSKLVRADGGVGSENAGKASHIALSPDARIVKRILSAKWAACVGWRS